MTLANGSRLGPYEIVAPIGAGGMGEVYRARDTRLGRTVAIKILPAEFASDAKLKIRFEREAKTISALSHPNICALHDVGPDYLVMEYCEGKTLAQRIAQGPLPIEQVIDYGMQIAGALDKAHRAGIVHRDLKPSNIIITKTGVKLLDFGLAKQSVDSSPEQSTVQHVTEEGKILGTVQYMAPELFAGKEADARSDIFAFGLILYEMATGKRAFSGTSKAGLIAAVLEHEPPHVDESAPLDRLIRDCIAKDPEQRMQSAHDLLLQMRRISQPEPQHARFRWRSGALAAGLIAVGAMGIITWKTLRPNEQRMRPHRFEIQPPAGVLVAGASAMRSLAISPDGEWIAFRGTSSDRTRATLYLRSTSQLETRAVLPPVTATLLEARDPFFSPDSKWLGFFSEGAVWKMPVTGGEPVRICAIRVVRGATWGDDGTILLSDMNRIVRISPDTGKLQVVATAPPAEKYFWPQFLPGSRHALITVAAGLSPKIALLSLDDGKIRDLVPGTYPRVAKERVLYARNGVLFSLPFDYKRLRASGEPQRVLDDVNFYSGNGFTAFDLAADGSLVFVPGAARVSDAELVWMDREGHLTSAVSERKAYDGAVLSPDGKRIATAIMAQTLDDEDVWTVDLETGVWTRLTSGMHALACDWAPDGKSILVVSWSSGMGDLYRVSADGTGAPQRLTTSADTGGGKFSPDGKTVMFARQIAGQWDLMTLSLAGGAVPQPFLATPGHETSNAFSPDGRWVAYVSDETGDIAVHVRPSRGGDPNVTIPIAGSKAPSWSRDGRELFFRQGGAVWSVSVSVDGGFHAGRPKRLFALETRGEWSDALDPSADGTRFLTIRLAPEDQPERRIVYAPNWIDELKQASGSK